MGQNTDKETQPGQATPQGGKWDRYDTAAAVLGESEAGVKVLNSILDIADLANDLDEIEISAAATVLQFTCSTIVPVDPSADIRRRNPVIVTDRRPNGKEAA
jgi:hypothetical protein